jgi:hypothetical protein
MMFTIKATQSGKTIRVYDRISGQTVFNAYLDINATSDLTVGSQDGVNGQVDIWFALQGPANTIWGSSPNAVTAGQILEIEGE